MRAGISTRALIAGSIIAWSSAAAAAETDLCSPGVERAASYVAEAELLAAAARIEGQVQAARASGNVIPGEPDFGVLPASASVKPGAAALARYCLAAGELSLLAERGSQEQARSLFLGALDYARQANLPALTGRIAYRLGTTATGGMPLRAVRGAGGLRRARTNLAAQLRSAAASPDGTASSCAMLATTGQASDSRGVALLSLDCAARIASSAGDHRTAAVAGLRFANGAIELARSFEEPETLRRMAAQRIAEALKSAALIDDPAIRAELLSRLANLGIDLGLERGVIETAIGGIQSAQAEPGALASVAELRGRLALKAGQTDAARAFIEAAVFQESRRALPYRLPSFYVLLAAAEPERRAQHVGAAYAALQNLRPRIPRFDPLTDESMFSMHMRKVFEAAASAQLEVANDDAGLHAAQRIVEDFREAELQSALGSECLPQRSPLQAGDLAEGEALLYPLVFEDRLELIFVSGRGTDTRFVRLPPNRNVGGQHVAALAERLSVALNSGSDGDWRVPARELYDLLIKPIEHHLDGNSSLAIVPDRAMRGVPFAMLMAGDGRYLVERTALSVAPALAYSQPGTQAAGEQATIVAASLEREVTLAGTSFPALAGTGSEARNAAEHGSPGRWLADFTRDELAAALSADSADVLHLATHASFNGRSDKAFIVARDGLIPIAELRDMISKNSVRDGLLDLLVLSACETAVGDDESSMGLAGAAIGAGAVSAIASLWPVDDVGATELMRQFYGNYQGGMSRAQALRMAQVSLLKNGGDNADPFVWAAFTLVGAWR